MKKLLLVSVCLILLVGCNKKENKVDTIDDKEYKFVLKKKDDSKEYIIFNEVRKLNVDDEEYILKNLEVNVISDDIDNINLEIKTFVNNSNKNYVLSNNKLISGNVIDYDYYMNEKYLSIIQKYYLYVDGIKGEENDNVYNINLDTGQIISNNDLLKEFGLDEEKLYDRLEKSIISEDVLYTLLNIRNSGYKLFVNNDNQLGIIYYEVNDEESIRKELILN